jgi:hypothetical protein
VAMNGPEKVAETVRRPASRPRRRAKCQLQSFVVGIVERATRALSRRPHLSIHRGFGRVEHPG